MPQNAHILIIDDDKKFVERVKNALAHLGKITAGYNEGDFYALFRPHVYDLLLIDMRLKEEKEGLELLKYAREEDPAVPVVVITAYASVDTAIEALQTGAKTYIQKEKVLETELVAIVERYIQEKKANERIEFLLKERGKIHIVGEDSKIKAVLKLCRLAAEDGESSVLIRGETGTGKELIARFIHETGKRKEGPFVAVAISSLNKDTITSELFGHEKGAFTGANSRHQGYFEQAHKGVLFLDEIGDLSLDVQKMLLRVLETKTFRRLGGKQDIEVDIQLLTATNAPLEKMVEQGSFRSDLYYRLKVIEIVLPPLRERKNDIMLLAEYFLKDLYKKGRTTAKRFSSDVEQVFLQFHWPGNVRELKNVVERAGLMAKLGMSEIITLAHLPNDLSPKKIRKEVNNVEKILAETELIHIQDALGKTGWKKTEAWRILGYKNRFILRRRVVKIFNKFPEFAEVYRKLYKAFMEGNGEG